MVPPDDTASSTPALPVGVVTFLLTDVESSTRLSREPSAAGATMRRQAELIASAVARHGGVQPLEQGEGDSMVTAFVRASDAVAAALDAQRALAAEPWPEQPSVRVRMAVHQIGLILVDALETLALVAADVAHDARAGRLPGTAEAFRERTGYRWRPHHRRTALEALRGRLAPGALTEGAAMGLDEAVSYARRGRGERRRPEFGWDSLTPTEVRVVGLVAAGLPNREIASRLFVSPATVKTHLVHVYDELGLRGRAELAAASRGLARAAAVAQRNDAEKEEDLS